MHRRHFLLLAASPALAAAADPWVSSETIEPDAFAQELSSNARAATILYVGFPVLYRAAHITGATLAGPCSKPAGLDTLKAQLARLPATSHLVLYCGCCPFDQCPNIRPAYTAAHSFKLASLRVLHLPTNLHTDWILKGYPVERVSAS